MTFKYMSKHMAILVMCFLIFTQNTFAQSTTEQATQAVKKAASKISNSVQRQIHKHAIGVGLGQTFLMGKFEQRGDDKITGDFIYAYTASYSFDLLLNLHSSEHTYRDQKVWLRGLTMSIKARSYEFDAFSPFLMGGLGFYKPSIENEEGERSELKNTFGMNLGAGVDLRLNNKVVIGLLTHYHLPFEVKQDNMENVRGSYFKLLLTGMYLF